jgi:hypothetical protein
VMGGAPSCGRPGIKYRGCGGKKKKGLDFAVALPTCGFAEGAAPVLWLIKGDCHAVWGQEEGREGEVPTFAHTCMHALGAHNLQLAPQTILPPTAIPSPSTTIPSHGNGR